MRKMKDSGIEWIGKIPDNWSNQRFKYVVNSLNKGNGITKDEVFPNGNVECVRYGEIYSKYNHSFQDCFSRTNKEVVSSPQYFSYGDILFAGTGELIEEIGKNIVYLGSNACLAGGDIIVAKHSQNPSFLNYAMSSYYAQYQKSLGKAKLKVVHITAPQIGNIRIILPPLPEQKRIADFLDAKCADIDQIRADIEKQIEILTDYKKSVITEAVTKGLDPKAKLKDSGIEWIGKIPNDWKTLKVKYLATEPDSLFTDGDWINSDIITEEGVRYLTSGNVGEGYFKKQGDGYISQESFEQLHCLKALPNDLMICRLNLPIGRSCIIPNDEPFYVVAVDNVILRPNHDIDKKFIMYCMNTPGYAAEAEMAAGGTTMKRISRTDLGNLVVPIPSLEEQKAIADYLDEKCSEIDATIAEKQKQLETLEEYKKSLIFEYVTGKKEVPA